MNLSQFKSWFEGFTENLNGVPNKKQWARIQERVEEISPDPMPSTVFIDRYVRPYPQWWGVGWTPYNTSGTVGSSNTGIQGMTTNDPGQISNCVFHSAGALEAQEVASNS